jgi:uncharacterized protein YgiM (DUF1202 family)
MKQLLLVCVLVATSVMAAAQNTIGYVCYSTGLNMRKQPSIKAEVLGKIPYATKISYNAKKLDTVPVIVEGMTGYWLPVTHQGKKGYVLSCYLTTLKPPTKGTKNMEDYLLQISALHGGTLIVSNDVITTIEAGGRKSTKQLYKNGAQHNTFYMYEYSSDTYMIPKISMEEAFLLLRQIEEFSDFFTEKEEFPTKSKKWEKQINNAAIPATLSIFNYDNDRNNRVNKITMQLDQGGLQVLDIYMLEDEIIIFKSFGV